MKRKRIAVLPHQGMGDLMLCLGMFREFESKYQNVYLIVRRPYSDSIGKVFSRSPRVTVISIPHFPKGIWFRRLELLVGYAIGLVFFLAGARFLALGYLGKSFFGKFKNTKFDQSFYDQAQTDFDFRWSKFRIDEISKNWTRLSKLMNLNSDGYVFVHEDRERGFLVDRSKIPKNYRIIEPLPPDSGFEIWDYIGIIQGAKEIHVIESSFAALIESLQIDVPKFAYRNARPEAMSDPNHEFTYRSVWTIVQ